MPQLLPVIIAAQVRLKFPEMFQIYFQLSSISLSTYTHTYVYINLCIYVYIYLFISIHIFFRSDLTLAVARWTPCTVRPTILRSAAGRNRCLLPQACAHAPRHRMTRTSCNCTSVLRNIMHALHNIMHALHNIMHSLHNYAANA